jgi:RNA polymerase-interacting CarD/CdnL/TRCF family regulator
VKKNQSPQQVRRVVQSLLDVMNEQGLTHLDKQFLEAVVRRCNEELTR